MNKVVSGWFRAQYITVDSTLDGIPNVIIYVTRNVDEEKRRQLFEKGIGQVK